jgi:hypothetical protein
VWNAGRREQFNRNTNLTYNPVTGVNYPYSFFDAANPVGYPNRVWPDLGIMLQVFSQGQSNYHAMETAFTKRFSNKWQASVTYTLSKFHDYQPSPVNGAFKVPEDLGDVWYPAQGDQRHRAVVNSIWELPYKFQVSGLYFYGSGQGFGTNWGTDRRNSGNYSLRLRPDGTVVPSVDFYGKPIHRADFKVLRRFPIHGRATVEGTFEMFNVFNHANFGNYVINEVSPLFGAPQQNFNVAYLPRMLQLGFRVTF